jgi:hypothetical protein
MVTSTIDRQWYLLARRPMNSASPLVVAGLSFEDVVELTGDGS